MKKLLVFLFLVPLISKAHVEKELILNTITIDSIKLDLVSFSYSDGIDLVTHEGIIATDLIEKKFVEIQGFDDYPSRWVTYLSLLHKKQIKRLKSQIKEVKKFKDISFKKRFNDYNTEDFDELYGDDSPSYFTPIEITYNLNGNHKFGIMTYDEESRILIPFDISSSIKYGQYFDYDEEVYEVYYFEKPFFLTTDLDGMEQFIAFLENK